MKLLLFLFSFLLLASCTYDPDGLTFVDIKKPEAGAPIEVTLSNNTDSIYLYANTNITFSVNTLGKKFDAAVIHYYDKEIKTNSLTSTFTIEPKETADWTDLSIDFYVATNSGSVANQLKSEFAKVTKKWKIKYIDIKKIGLKSSYRIHKDGYVQVYIVKPKGAVGLIYDNSYSNDNAIKSENGDTIFYALKRYVSGYQYITFYAKLSSSISLYSESISFNLPVPTFEVTKIMGDSCILSCTSSPIKCYYGVNGKILEGTTANWKVPYIFNNFYNSVYINVYAWGDFQGLNQISSISINKPLIGNEYYFKSCYSLDKDRFYLSFDANIPALKSSSLPLPIGTEWASNPKMIISCSPNGKYIGGYYNNKIYVYGDDLKSEIQLSADAISNYRKYIAVTNDGVFTYLKGAEIVMKNLTGVGGWQSFSFTSNADANLYINYVSNIANTIDGKYVCVRGASDFKIYDVSNHTTATVIYENASGDYRGAIAHPTNPSLIYAKKATSIELRSLPSFELIKTINLPFTSFYMHALDPYTSIFVLSSDYYYYFLDAETGKIVFKLRSMWEISNEETSLNRNQFVSNTRIIDLTNYLKK